HGRRRLRAAGGGAAQDSRPSGCGAAARRCPADADRPLHRRSRGPRASHGRGCGHRGAADAARIQPLSMIHLTRALVRRWLDALLHIDDTPERTAAAFALGVFFGFSPLLGLHTVLGVLFAFLLNLNRVAVLLGVYSHLPWVIAPYYAFVTMAGAQITGHRS